jgi:hypothetical protein
VVLASPAFTIASRARVSATRRASTAAAIRVIDTPLALPSATFRSSSVTGIPASAAASSEAVTRVAAAVESCAASAVGARASSAARYRVLVRIVSLLECKWEPSPT